MAKKAAFTPVVVRGTDVLTDLSINKWVATAEQVGELARVYVDHQTELANIGGSYLKVLIASTLHALGAEIRTAPLRGRAPKHDEAEKERQSKAFEEVQGSFYGAVLSAVIPAELQDDEGKPQSVRSANALERNRRTNFARSAASTVRSFLRNGGDLRILNVSTVTKGQLAELAASKAPAKPEAVVLGNRVEAVGKRALRLLEKLAKEDEGAARHRLEALVSMFAAQLAVIGVEKTTQSPEQAIAKCMPLQTKAGVFFPITGVQNGGTLQ